MKIRHHIPRQALLRREVVTPEYQAEVDKTTNRAQRRYEAAQRGLARAELKRLAHESTKSRAAAAGDLRDYERKLKVLDELVELRRQELQKVESMMKSVPASAEHRGRKGYRPIPKPAGGV